MPRSLLSLLLVLLLAACAATQPPPGEDIVRYGKVSKIDAVSLDGDHQLGFGAILGAVAGGVLGHQIGGGTGRDIATVAGALAGGVVGNKAQNRYGERRPGQHIIVQLDNGVAVGITQAGDSGLRVGDRVRIDGSGEDARVVRR